jgi:hypothetical protein
MPSEMRPCQTSKPLSSGWAEQLRISRLNDKRQMPWLKTLSGDQGPVNSTAEVTVDIALYDENNLQKNGG